MAKESSKITRVDVRIPNEIYEKINQIAIETNQPLHHRSGKPVVTPIILNLINLGLEALSQEDFNSESLSDKLSAFNRINLKSIEEKVTANLANKASDITRIDTAEMEKKILALLEVKLESLVEAKVTKVLQNISLLNTESEVDEEIKSKSISYFPDEDEREDLIPSTNTKSDE
jgi:hypothetical protein